MTEDKFNKILLDLEIMGLINVAWITKDTRRIEVIVEKEEVDEALESIGDEQQQRVYISFSLAKTT